MNNHYRLIQNASRLAIIISTIIILIKIHGVVSTSSASMFASLLDSFLDFSTSTLNFVAIKFAAAPADDKHRFGHEKILDVVVFTQALIFCSFGAYTIFSAIQSYIVGHHIHNSTEGIVIMILSMILNLVLIIYQSYVVRKTQSLIIHTDKLHYFTDFFTNFAVIISLFIAQYMPGIDVIFAIAIGVYILVSAAKLLLRAFAGLIDSELSKHQSQEIIDIIKSYPEVRGIHELKTRYACGKIFIQFHLELDGHLSLLEAHAITDKVIDAIEIKFDNTEIIVHQDPVGLEQNTKFKVF